MAATQRPRRTTTRSASDLSDHSDEVLREAEQYPVTIVRHDGEDLLLLTKNDYDERSVFLDLVEHVLTAALDTPSLEIGLALPYPWILSLSDEDRGQFVEELVGALRPVSSHNQQNRALGVLLAWRESAEAIACGLLDVPIMRREETSAVPRP